MAITINWGTSTINVPQSFLTPLGGSAYTLDTNAFRLALKDLEDSEAGMISPPTHTHNTAVTLGGIEYARVIAILPPYTVTFEETGAPYTVSLAGSNNNFLEKTNLGTVQILSSNSAGLINVAEVQQGAFEGRVHIDAANSSGKAKAGTTYPTGTRGAPCLTLADAKAVAMARGFMSFHVMGDLTIGATEDVTEYSFHGEGATLNATRTTVTFTAGCVTAGAHFHNCRITGQQGGETNYHECIIDGLSGAHCHYDRCGFKTSLQSYAVQASSTLSSTTHMTDLHSCYGGFQEVVVDRNGSKLNQRWMDFRGNIKFINQTHATQSGSIWINMNGGTVTIDASCTKGAFYISGNCKVINNSGGATVDVSEVVASNVSAEAIADEVWQHATGAAVAARLAETWARLGLDASKPVTQGDTQISFGSVVLALSMSGSNGTIARQ